jgi:pimeloyl-ACP methyl ester carboxylesterase
MLHGVQPQTSFVEAPDYRLEYVDIPATATGRPDLLFLHEGLGSVSLWRDFPQLVADRTGCRAIAYSREGFGRSSSRSAPYTPGFMHREAFNVVPAIREKLGIAKPVLVGHSTGASMALIHAGCDVAGVAGVVAIAPFAFVEESNLEAIRSARDRYAQLRPRLARHHDHVDDVFHGWTDLWLDPEFRDWDIDDDLERIRCPILSILGEKDEYCTAAQLERIAERVSHADRIEMLRLPQSGHSPHRDEPETVIAAIDRFIHSLER